MLQTLALAFIQADPALGDEAVRIREDVRIDVQEYGSHANDGLGGISRDIDQVRALLYSVRDLPLPGSYSLYNTGPVLLGAVDVAQSYRCEV